MRKKLGRSIHVLGSDDTELSERLFSPTSSVLWRKGVFLMLIQSKSKVQKSAFWACPGSQIMENQWNQENVKEKWREKISARLGQLQKALKSLVELRPAARPAAKSYKIHKNYWRFPKFSKIYKKFRNPAGFFRNFSSKSGNPRFFSKFSSNCIFRCLEHVKPILKPPYKKKETKNRLSFLVGLTFLNLGTVPTGAACPRSVNFNKRPQIPSFTWKPANPENVKGK